MDGSSAKSLPPVTYGFIGIGIMGFGMAQNLRWRIPKDSLLVICDVNKQQIDKFRQATKGAIEVAETPKDVAQRADIIVTMLPKGPHVKEVYTDTQSGLLAAQVTKSILFMESSTIDTMTSLEVNKIVTSAGHRFVDAPVSGGPKGAYAATLTFMVGGTPELFKEVRPLAESMGKKENIYHCGKAGAGLATKQINNYLSAICALGTSEAFNMGRLYGLDPVTLASVINVSTGFNYNSSEQNPVKGVTASAHASNDFEGGFSMELCKGVLDMASGLGKQVGARSVLSEVIEKTFEEAMQDERCKAFRATMRRIQTLLEKPSLGDVVIFHGVSPLHVLYTDVIQL